MRVPEEVEALRLSLLVTFTAHEGLELRAGVPDEATVVRELRFRGEGGADRRTPNGNVN